MNQTKHSSVYKVEPIRNIADILAIKRLLCNSPRDLLLFTMGINTWLCIGDILNLTLRDLQHAKPGDEICIKPGKQNKQGTLIINHTIYQSLKFYFSHLENKGLLESQVYLFQSRKGGKPLSISSVNNLVKEWTELVGLEGNYGGHSLRKTWGYHHWIESVFNCLHISKIFNHTTASVTKKYLCIKDHTESNLFSFREIGDEHHFGIKTPFDCQDHSNII